MVLQERLLEPQKKSISREAKPWLPAFSAGWRSFHLEERMVQEANFLE